MKNKILTLTAILTLGCADNLEETYNRGFYNGWMDSCITQKRKYEPNSNSSVLNEDEYRRMISIECLAEYNKTFPYMRREEVVEYDR